MPLPIDAGGNMADPLASFLPPVADWFRNRFGAPTPVQSLGWPSIAAGRNTLLLAPTGSGKTLAAFLACLDGLWRQAKLARGVRILYISPLKALNNDIFRNLETPLEEVARTARAMGYDLPRIDIAVRTGDTPAAERQRLVRRPPHLLITTPESLHLLLTSQAHSTLRGLTHVLIDEIHALCPNKRGVFLSLLLERLQALQEREFVRVGLSATQRPLEEVARFLGGRRSLPDGTFEPRPVHIVDAGLRKNLDLRVASPVETFGPLPEKSVWPSIYRYLAEEIRGHHSTIVFANNRRAVERITHQLQELFDERSIREWPDEEDRPAGEKAQAGERSAEQSQDKPADIQVRAHHGSVSLDVRRDTEESLKNGTLRAVVATSSLELGIDMGAVDLVCQVESPGNVARGLQRVGRAGHLVGSHSKGRLIPKTLADLLDQAVLAAEMAAGRVEELRVPTGCLDVLAQQVVALVAMEDWEVGKLFDLVRRAYPYRDLTAAAFEAVLEMVSGRYRFEDFEAPPLQETTDAPAAPGGRVDPAQRLSALQPRVRWDRIRQRLQALPGSQRLALVHGGVIPDTGQFAVVTLQNQRIGELDEEFVFERRVGEAFLLGTSTWRIDRIESDRVVVFPAAGAAAVVPFWRGERTGRSFDLGQAQGRFLRELAARLDSSDCLAWLQREHFLDEHAARNLRDYVRRQMLRTGCVPSDRLLLIEAARDPLGDWQVVLHSQRGQRFNFTLRLALENLLRRRLGYRPQCLHHDDGILIRLTESDEPVLDILDGLTPDNLQDLVLEELADSALFALRFRQNAARALMMPRGGAGRRAPLWLQRLRGKDLLQVARRFPDFPLMVETFRECLQDHLDVPHVRSLLQSLNGGDIELRACRLEVPSPFSAGLWFAFNAVQMYQYDEVESETGSTYAHLDHDLLAGLISEEGGRLDPDERAVRLVDERLRGVGRPPRSEAEAAEWLRRLGDLAPEEVQGAAAIFFEKLVADGTALELDFPGTASPRRWVLAEQAAEYRFLDQAFSDAEEKERGATLVLHRFLRTRSLVGLQDILARYPLDPGWVKRQLEAWSRTGRVVRLEPPRESEPVRWSAPENFDQVRRNTLSLLRREVVACSPQRFAAFLLARHGIPAKNGKESLPETLSQLEGLPLPVTLWERAILPARLTGFRPDWLDEIVQGGTWVWLGRGSLEDSGPGDLAFVDREGLARYPPPTEGAEVDAATLAVLERLQQRGALFTADLASACDLGTGKVRAALWRLVRLGLVTNDRFETARAGEPIDPVEEAAPMRSRRQLRTFLKESRRRFTAVPPEGRWSLIPWSRPDMEVQVLAHAHRLLDRYGVISRDLAALDPLAPPWRVLYEVFSRLEMTGELRRGFFVEGLAGAQFALPEAARSLQDSFGPERASGRPVLLSSLDPVNLFGSGAPLDISLLAGGTRPFARRPSNWLVLGKGRPILLIEQQGKKITALPSASTEETTAAVRLLPGLLGESGDLRHRLTVETWNEQPVTSTPGKDLLEAAGFVRDYQAMTLYAVWR